MAAEVSSGVWLLDEQGAESIHAKFNTLKDDTYRTMLDKVKRHTTSILPLKTYIALRLPIKKLSSSIE